MVAPSQPFAGKAQPLDGGVKAPRKAQSGGGGGGPFEGKLNMIQIISSSAKREAPQTNIDEFLAKLNAMVQKQQVKLLQIGNTVFLIRQSEPGVAEFHTFTVEPPESLVKRYQAGAKSLKQMGFKKAISYTDNKAFGKLAEMTGLPVKSSPMTDPKTGKPTIRYELEL